MVQSSKQRLFTAVKRRNKSVYTSIYSYTIPAFGPKNPEFPGIFVSNIETYLIYPLLKPSKYAVLRAVRCEKKPRNVGNSSIIPALLLYTYSYTKESLLVVSDALTGVPLRGGFFFVIGKKYKLFYFFYFVF